LRRLALSPSPFLLRWLVASSRTALVQPLGLALLVVGSVALLWCVRDFYVSGKGTLAPWAPPAHLVIVGLYRYTRNPMYVAVALIFLGWAVSFGSLGLFLYTIIVAIAFGSGRRAVAGSHSWRAVARVFESSSSLVLVSTMSNAKPTHNGGADSPVPSPFCSVLSWPSVKGQRLLDVFFHPRREPRILKSNNVSRA
jgi:hypothetical protein